MIKKYYYIILIILYVILNYYINIYLSEAFNNSNLPCTVICMPRRKSYMKDTMKKYKLQPYFFNAIQTYMLDKNKIKTIPKYWYGSLEHPNKQRKLKKTEIACYVSHMNVIIHFLNNINGKNTIRKFK